MFHLAKLRCSYRKVVCTETNLFVPKQVCSRKNNVDSVEAVLFRHFHGWICWNSIVPALASLHLRKQRCSAVRWAEFKKTTLLPQLPCWICGNSIVPAFAVRALRDRNPTGRGRRGPAVSLVRPTIREPRSEPNRRAVDFLLETLS